MHRLILLAQETEDLRRDAGLRGEDFTTAAIALAVVFLLGVGLVVLVAYRGRRKRRSGGAP